MDDERDVSKETMKEMYEREEGDKIRSLAYIGLGQMFLTGSLSGTLSDLYHALIMCQ